MALAVRVSVASGKILSGKATNTRIRYPARKSARRQARVHHSHVENRREFLELEEGENNQVQLYLITKSKFILFYADSSLLSKSVFLSILLVIIQPSSR